MNMMNIDLQVPGFPKEFHQSVMTPMMPAQQEMPNCQPQDMRKWVKKKDDEFDTEEPDTDDSMGKYMEPQLKSAQESWTPSRPEKSFGSGLVVKEPCGRGTPLGEQAQQMIINSYVHLLSVGTSEKEIIRRLSEMFLIGATAIRKLVKKGKTETPKDRKNKKEIFGKMADVDKDALRRIVYRYCNQGGLVTNAMDILKAAKKELNFPYESTTMRKLLLAMGFRLQKPFKKNKGENT